MEVIIERVLWKYKVLNNGEFMILIRLTKYKDIRYMPTGFSSSMELWDASASLPLPSHPDYRKIIKKVDFLTEETEFQVKLAEKNGEFPILTMAELKKRVLAKKNVQNASKKVLAFFDEIIKEMEDVDKVGYADVFMSCKSTVVKLLSGFKIEVATKEYIKEHQASIDKPFTAFTAKDFKDYETFINGLKAESTKSNYLRTLYRVWNIAIERKFCSEKLHPQLFIKYKAYKTIKTRKQAIPFSFIEDIEKLQFGYETRFFRSQKYAVFCYYARGVNFGDMTKLKYGENVRRGNLSYVRSKNHRYYDFQLHPKAKEVIEIFKNYPLQSDAGYVFPILMGLHDTDRKIKTRIHSALTDFNEDLEEFEEMVNSPKKIRSNVLRHSFATNLRQRNVGIGVIKEAMGHETEGQTQVYLDETDDTIIAQTIEAALQ